MRQCPAFNFGWRVDLLLLWGMLLSGGLCAHYTVDFFLIPSLTIESILYKLQK